MNHLLLIIHTIPKLLEMLNLILHLILLTLAPHLLCVNISRQLTLSYHILLSHSSIPLRLRARPLALLKLLLSYIYLLLSEELLLSLLLTTLNEALAASRIVQWHLHCGLLGGSMGGHAVV